MADETEVKAAETPPEVAEGTVLTIDEATPAASAEEDDTEADEDGE